MGWTSQDDLINQITTNGKYDKIIYQKTSDAATVIAGTWRDLGILGGSVPASTYAGTSLTFVATDDTWSEGVIPHGGDVSTATKHFLSAGASIVAAVGAPFLLMCVDQVGYVPITGADVTGTTGRTITMTAISNTAAKVDRYANGAGLRAYFSTEVAPTSGGPNLTAFTYTSTAGTPGRACPVTVGFMTAPIAGAIPHSGPAATRYAPFLPLAAGDTGIKDLEAFTLSGGTAYTGSGQLVLHLVKPLFTIPMPVTGLHCMTDFLNAMPSLPRIRDGACLRFLLYQTGATSGSSPIFVEMDYGYGG